MNFHFHESSKTRISSCVRKADQTGSKVKRNDSNAACFDNHDEQIGRVERAEVNVSASMLYLISKGLEISMSELLDFHMDE